MATLRQLTSGRWQAIIKRKGLGTKAKTFRTKAMASAWARQTEDKIDRGEYRDPTAAEGTTMPELLERYAAAITPRKKSSVKESSRIRILSSAFQGKSLARLSADDVIEYVDKRLESVSSDTVRKELSTLGHAIDTGMAIWGLHIHANPVATAKRILSVTKTLSQGNRRDRRVEDWEIEKIVAFSGSEKLCRVLVFAVETGLRRGELANVRKSHDKDTVLLVPDTKTGVPRTVPLTKRARAVLDSFDDDDDDAPLFSLAADSITQEFNRSKKAAGITDIRVHDLRHEATSRFFEMGLSIEEVASITGHTDWKTLKRYTHISPQRLAKKLL